MIFQPILPNGEGAGTLLFYGETFRFDPAHNSTTPEGERVCAPAPGTDMFLLCRHYRSSGARMGDIMKVADILEIVELVPKFGRYADERLTCNNCLELGDEFYLNNFAGKETFHAILSYQ